MVAGFNMSERMCTLLGRVYVLDSRSDGSSKDEKERCSIKYRRQAGSLAALYPQLIALVQQPCDLEYEKEYTKPSRV